MSGVFISYRRDDCAGHAGRLYDRLVDRLGEQGVFMDIDAIEPGMDFGVRIDEAVGSCRALIVLIGDDWLEIADGGGRRRLDDPADLVRLEVAAGLSREGLRVIPVLVEGARMPSADELPDDLKALSRRNALELSDARWRYDVERLVEVIDRVAPPAGKGGARSLRERAAARRSPLIGLALVAVALVAAIKLFDPPDERSRARAPSTPQRAVDDLRRDPERKAYVLELVSPAGTSTQQTVAAYASIKLLGPRDQCDYSAGIVGFCSRGGDIRNGVERIGALREQALKRAPALPNDGGDEIRYLDKFADAMAGTKGGEDRAVIKRIRNLLNTGNLDLDPLPR